MTTLISVKKLKKIYKVGEEKVRALDGIDLDIERGEICCILGTSGSGKSTLLNMLAGLEAPTKGEIRIGKVRIDKMSEGRLTDFRRRHVGFVFQSYNLMNALPAWANVAMPLEFRGVDKKTREKAAKDMLKAVDLANRVNHTPGEMSGGQQQRVGIARAFVHHPQLVFADEPTGNLDSKTTIEVMKLMVSMARQHEQTLIIVTHDPEIAEYADRVIHLIDGKIDRDSRIDSEALNVPEAGKN
ncbi:MAG: ABC transporter ATP-binding protein [Bacillota bacterium]|nr:ABC transporter ATP-binding protein [Bacillota bacterium]